jgi:hypothetical protein
MGDVAMIRTGQSAAALTHDAVAQFHAATTQAGAALVMFFCSTAFDPSQVGVEMRELFGDVPMIGCTTAGEFGPIGYRDDTIAGVSLPATDFAAVAAGIDDLDKFDFEQAQQLVDRLWDQLRDRDPSAGETSTFAVMLIDGTSAREEPVTLALQEALRGVPLIGGSAGDGLAFATSYVYAQGRFAPRTAALALVSTELPFTVFKTQHFDPMTSRAVVTSADAERRLIKRIDGLPAAEGYARLVGAPQISLDPTRFASHPVVVLIDGTSYVRSIQKVNEDLSLTLFCAIEEGVVLRAARGVDLVDNLEQIFAGIEAEIGHPQLVLGCDCVLRKLEIVGDSLAAQVEELFHANNVVGFNSYGEQYRGVHVNQTLTGVAIGSPGGRDGAP